MKYKYYKEILDKAYFAYDKGNSESLGASQDSIYGEIVKNISNYDEEIINERDFLNALSKMKILGLIRGPYRDENKTRFYKVTEKGIYIYNNIKTPDDYFKFYIYGSYEEYKKYKLDSEINIQMLIDFAFIYVDSLINSIEQNLESNVNLEEKDITLNSDINKLFSVMVEILCSERKYRFNNDINGFSEENFKELLKENESDNVFEKVKKQYKKQFISSFLNKEDN